MDNILDEIEESKELSDKEIFTKIWTSPRQVLTYIHETRYDKYMVVLLLLSGIANAMDRSSTKNMGDKMSLLAVLAICIIAGGLFGWISYYIFAGLVSWTGKWLNGQGDTRSILRLFAYSAFPSILSLVFLIPQIVVYGNELFKSDGDIVITGVFSNILVYGTLVINFVLSVYGLVLSVISISVVQKFSIGRSIGNLVTAALVIIIPVFFLVFAMMGIF